MAGVAAFFYKRFAVSKEAVSFMVRKSPSGSWVPVTSITPNAAADPAPNLAGQMRNTPPALGVTLPIRSV